MGKNAMWFLTTRVFKENNIVCGSFDGEVWLQQMYDCQADGEMPVSEIYMSPC